MCGRYVITLPPAEIVERFDVDMVAHKFTMNYNVAPTQMVPVLVAGSTVLDTYRWGLIPHWAKDEKVGYRMINSRIETIAEKPSFKHSFLHKRCLIPATGFFEWKKRDDGKQPLFIHMKDKVFAFAGIYAEWKKKDKIIKSCSIITCDANSFMKKIHHRMPVIIQRRNEKKWIDTDMTDKDELLKLLKPRSASEMDAYPVSTIVNSPRNNSKENLAKIL
jgi:putative SOS response-associated peptidase YedK